MKCPKCDFENDKDAKYCEKCGTKLEVKRKPINKSLIAIVCIVLVILIFLICPKYLKKKEYDNLLKSAAQYVMDKKFQEAEQAYLELLKYDDGDYDIYLSLADVYVQNDKRDEAIAMLKEAQKIFDSSEKTLITDKLEELENFIDFDNLVKDMYNQSYGEYHYSLPQLYLSEDIADKINKEVIDQFLNSEKIYLSQEQYGSKIPVLYKSVEYEWGIKDNILSIIVTGNYMMTDMTEYLVYNIDLNTMKQLGKQELLEKFNYTLAWFNQRSVEEIGGFLVNKMKDTFLVLNDDNKWALETTFTKENISKSYPYVDKNGNISIIGTYAWGIGGGFQSKSFNLEKKPEQTLSELLHYIKEDVLDAPMLNDENNRILNAQ